MKTNHQEVDLFETGKAPTVQNVKVGDVIKVKQEKEHNPEEKMVKWMVREVYPFFVYATSGSRHKCFNYGMLVQLGLESQYTANYRDVQETGEILG